MIGAPGGGRASGSVNNIYRASAVAGVYCAAAAGLRSAAARAIVLTNQKGAVLELSGRADGERRFERARDYVEVV